MFEVDVFFRPVSKQHFGRPWNLARSQPEFELIDLKIFYAFFFLFLFFSYFIFCIGKKTLTNTELQRRDALPALRNNFEWLQRRQYVSSLRADVSYFLPPAEKGRLRNGVANRVPVSCCPGFKFRINYDNTVLFSVPESFPSDRSMMMIGGRTGLRGGI